MKVTTIILFILCLNSCISNDKSELFSIKKISKSQYEEVLNNKNELVIDDKISKADSTITINLKNGKKFTIRDENKTWPGADHENILEYEYIGHYQNKNFALIKSSEGLTILVDLNNGEFYEFGSTVHGHIDAYGFSSIPIISPKENKFALIQAVDTVNTLTLPLENIGFQIWQKDSSIFKKSKIIEFGQKNWSPEEIIWVNENCLFLKIRGINNVLFSKSNPQYDYLEVRLNDLK